MPEPLNLSAEARLALNFSGTLFAQAQRLGLFRPLRAFHCRLRVGDTQSSRSFFASALAT